MNFTRPEAVEFLPRKFPWILLAIFCCGLALRLIYLAEASGSPFFAHLGLDAAQYHERAVGLVNGTWPTETAFFWPPLYPLLLGLLYKIVGSNPNIVKIIQAILGSGSCVFVYLIARQLFAGKFVPIAAATICCLCGTMIYFDAQLLSANLDVFLQLLVIYGLLIAARRGHLIWWLLAGAWAGLSAINRGSILLFLPLVLAWIHWQPHWRTKWQDDAGTVMPKSRVWKRTIAFLLPVALLVSPIAWHNAKYDLPTRLLTPSQADAEVSVSKTFKRLVSGRFVLLAWPIGVNFYIGNHWDLRELNDPNHPRCFLSYRRITDEPSRQGIRSAAESSRYLIRQTIRDIGENPVDLIKLMSTKLFRLLNGAEMPRNMTIYPDRQYSILLSALLWKQVIAFPSGLIIPFGLVGIFLARSAWRRRSLLLGCLLTQSIFVLAFFATARYRLLSISLLAMYAAYSIEVFLHHIRKREYAKITVPLLLLIALGILSNISIGKMDSNHGAFEHSNLGIDLAQQGRIEEAISHFSKALRIQPECVEAHMTLGLALERQGQTEEAIAQFAEALRIHRDYAEAHMTLGRLLNREARTEEAVHHLSEALRVHPDYVEAHLTLGQISSRQGKTKNAMDHFAEILRNDPNHQEAHMALGIALGKQGKLGQAMDHFTEVLRIDPDNAKAHYNLGIALAREGEIEKAVVQLSEALRIDPDYAKAHYNLALALVKQGKTQEAAVHYSKAVRLGLRPSH